MKPLNQKEANADLAFQQPNSQQHKSQIKPAGKTQRMHTK